MNNAARLVKSLIYGQASSEQQFGLQFSCTGDGRENETRMCVNVAIVLMTERRRESETERKREFGVWCGWTSFENLCCAGTR